jgi:SAM-dependent methyltransferase
VRIPGSRTWSILLHKTRGLIFDKGGFQATIDLREKHALEDSMGFRGQFDEHRRFQIEMLKVQGLLPKHRFLELGCGPLTAALPVIKFLDRGNYIGVDIRSAVLNMGWVQVGKASLSGKNPRLVCSDRFADEALESGEQFDFVYSFSVLYHLSDEILERYFSAVARRLKPTGICLANINEHMPSDRWLEFPFEKRTVTDYESVAAKNGLRTENLGTTEKLGFRNNSTEKRYPVLKFTLA